MSARTYLVHDYAGGTRILYAGRNPGIAAERRRFLVERCGWPAAGFTTVRASSTREAHEKGQAILWARLHGGER